MRFKVSFVSPQPPGRRKIVSRLQDLERAGVTHLPRSKPLARTRSAPDSPPARTSQRTGQVSSSTPSAAQTPTPPSASASGATPSLAASTSPLNLSARQSALSVLAREVRDCARCPELVGNRTQTVFGVGDPQARLCFLGEAPGADEDRRGEPFVGRAGQLLDKIMEACRLERSAVYILNICKCRPPENRAPEAEEAANCRGFLDRQLEIIQPEFICCLGAVAAQNLLNTTTSIGKLRGRLHDYRGVQVLCTYHPAYLLRNPPMKRECWEDMKLLMRAMGQPVE